MRPLLPLSIGLTLLLPFATHASFRDVPSDHPNDDAIEYVQSQGLVEGYRDDTYRPDQTINRAEFTKILARMQYAEEVEQCRRGEHRDLGGMFADMKRTDWYAPYVCAANLHDVINGYKDRTFRGSAPVNFVEAAKMLIFAYNLQQPYYGGTWFAGPVRALAARHAIPLSITSFDQSITRGEMAEILYRMNAGRQDLPSQTYESIDGWETYIDPQGTFSIRHPRSWNVGVGENYPLRINMPVGAGTESPYIMNAFVVIEKKCQTSQSDIHVTFGGTHVFAPFLLKQPSTYSDTYTMHFTPISKNTPCVIMERTVAMAKYLMKSESDFQEGERQKTKAEESLDQVLQTILFTAPQASSTGSR